MDNSPGEPRSDIFYGRGGGTDRRSDRRRDRICHIPNGINKWNVRAADAIDNDISCLIDLYLAPQ
jgi:hypothetical protein